MSKNRKTAFVVHLQRPVCRTPIKPLQTHKNEVKYTRKVKHTAKYSPFANGE